MAEYYIVVVPYMGQVSGNHIQFEGNKTHIDDEHHKQVLWNIDIVPFTYQPWVTPYETLNALPRRASTKLFPSYIE